MNFLSICCLFLGRLALHMLPLLIVESVFIKTVPLRDANVSTKTLIPFLFNCVLIDFLNILSKAKN